MLKYEQIFVQLDMYDTVDVRICILLLQDANSASLICCCRAGKGAMQDASTEMI